MNRSLDELTASELNAAIDDTNFPKAQSAMCLSRSADDTRSPTSAPQLNGNSIATPTAATASVGNGNTDDTAVEQAKDDQSNENGLQNGHKGFIKRVHPAPLKMVAFKGDSIDIPGTPRTPRTSTTPGETAFVFRMDERIVGNRLFRIPSQYIPTFNACVTKRMTVNAEQLVKRVLRGSANAQHIDTKLATEFGNRRGNHNARGHYRATQCGIGQNAIKIFVEPFYGASVMA